MCRAGVNGALMHPRDQPSRCYNDSSLLEGVHMADALMIVIFAGFIAVCIA